MEGSPLNQIPQQTQKTSVSRHGSRIKGSTCLSFSSNMAIVDSHQKKIKNNGSTFLDGQPTLMWVSYLVTGQEQLYHKEPSRKLGRIVLILQSFSNISPKPCRKMHNWMGQKKCWRITSSNPGSKFTHELDIAFFGRFSQAIFVAELQSTPTSKVQPSGLLAAPYMHHHSVVTSQRKSDQNHPSISPVTHHF